MWKRRPRAKIRETLQLQRMASDSLESWLQRLESIHPREIELGLDRISAVAGRMDLLQPSASVVTVAGTNGKGSTVAVLENLMLQAGSRAGAYTSPHLRRFNERIRVAGAEASDAEIVASFGRIEKARGDISLTYFEFATLAALDIFRARQCDVLLLEVGLGGRLDAVNVLDADLAVITSIDLDHQEWLGSDRAGISLEKAAIARCGRAVVISDRNPPAAMLEYLVAEGAGPVLQLGRDFDWEDAGAGQWRGSIRVENGALRQLPPVAAGGLLPDNILGAAQAAFQLGVAFSDEGYSRAALAGPTGRRQWRRFEGRDCLLDVAHNPASVAKLVDYLRASSARGTRKAVFAAMADKDIDGMLCLARGQFDAWYLGDLADNSRAATAKDIAVMLENRGEARISVNSNLPQAMARAREGMAGEDQLVVFGSFYTVAAVLPLLEEDAQL